MALTDVKEGFICPTCMKVFVDVLQLQSHFEDAHQNADDRDIVDQIRGIFGKARDTFLKFDYVNVNRTAEAVNPFEEECQMPFETDMEIGVLTSHTELFKKVRNSTIDMCVVETNKLLIRLDKLISHAPVDPAARKAFEKETVPWITDSSVHFCRFCSGRFGVTRRKHHCRLCGKVICNPCSMFLTFSFAQKLTNPAFAASFKAEVESSSRLSAANSPKFPHNTAERVEKVIGSIATKLKRDGSEHSLGSFFNQEGEDHLRVCKDCKSLLDRRDVQVEQRNQPPVIAQMYERLKGLMTEVEKIFPSYVKMAESLNSGETFYNIQTAQGLRLKMMKLHEQIDFTSKKILNLVPASSSVDDCAASASEKNIPPKQQMLQCCVRSYAVAFLKELAVGMPTLPTEDEYRILVNENKLAVQRQIEKERQAASQLSLAQVVQQGSVSGHRQKANSGSTSSMFSDSFSQSSKNRQQQKQQEQYGWTPDTSFLRPKFIANPFDDVKSDLLDPLQEQITNLKDYIKQAAEAGRLEELRSLEENLKELQLEMTLRTAST